MLLVLLNKTVPVPNGPAVIDGITANGVLHELDRSLIVSIERGDAGIGALSIDRPQRGRAGAGTGSAVLDAAAAPCRHPGRILHATY